MESASSCTALANVCSANVALSRVVCALGSVCATVANDLPVFALCRKRSGSSMGGAIVGFDRLEHFGLNIITRVTGLHQQIEENRAWHSN